MNKNKTYFNMAMTEHLTEALKLIKEKYPTQFFEATDLYGLPFNRPKWVCKRLAEEGKLEAKTKVDSYKPLIIVCQYKCIN